MATKPPKPTKTKIKKAIKKSTEKAKKKPSKVVKTGKPSFPIKTCKFIEVSELIPPEWTSWFWSAVSENAPFTWGENNHSMVSALDFSIHCNDVLVLKAQSTSYVKSSEITAFIKMLESLGNIYIDLEN
jgi:hypothetical protein